MQKRLLVVIIAILLMLAIQGEFSNHTSNTTNKALILEASLVSADIEKNVPKPELVVARVIDGDTILVNVNEVSEKIRLIGVNTPETVDPRTQVECFGREASEFTKTLLLDTPVILEADHTQGDRDKYGRLLRYVFLEDGTFINQKIIAEGYGHEYTYRTPYKYQAEFKDAERSARKTQKGLWAPEACKNS